MIGEHATPSKFASTWTVPTIITPPGYTLVKICRFSLPRQYNENPQYISYSAIMDGPSGDHWVRLLAYVFFFFWLPFCKSVSWVDWYCVDATAGWLSLQLSQVENNKPAIRDWYPGRDFIRLSQVLIRWVFQCQCDWRAAYLAYFCKMLLSIVNFHCGSCACHVWLRFLFVLRMRLATLKWVEMAGLVSCMNPGLSWPRVDGGRVIIKQPLRVVLKRHWYVKKHSFMDLTFWYFLCELWGLCNECNELWLQNSWCFPEV